MNNTNMQELNEALQNDPDFVCLSRYGCSLRRVLERYPDGVTDTMGAEALNIGVSEYEAIVAGAVEKLRTQL